MKSEEKGPWLLVSVLRKPPGVRVVGHAHAEIVGLHAEIAAAFGGAVLLTHAGKRAAGGVAGRDVGIDRMRELVLNAMDRRTPFRDIRAHIVEERIITPLDWRDSYDVYRGATFNLTHDLGQMLYFRPRNRFEEVRSCYLVGGGTHPGSGMPTIVESGRISANLLCRDLRVPFKSHNVKV